MPLQIQKLFKTVKCMNENHQMRSMISTRSNLENEKKRPNHNLVIERRSLNVEVKKKLETEIREGNRMLY